MQPAAGDGDWLSRSSLGRWRMTGNTVFSSPFLKIVYSVPSCRPHPSLGHRNVSAAVFSSQLLPACSVGVRYQHRSPQLPGALDAAKRSGPALDWQCCGSGPRGPEGKGNLLIRSIVASSSSSIPA